MDFTTFLLNMDSQMDLDVEQVEPPDSTATRDQDSSVPSSSAVSSFSAFDQPLGASQTPASTVHESLDCVDTSPKVSHSNPVKRFKPELLESSNWHGGRDIIHSISALPTSQTPGEPTEPLLRRFSPQLLESTRKVISLHPSSTAETSAQAQKKFFPQLIDTAKRSRRAGDSGPVLFASDRTDAVAFINQPTRKRKGVPPPSLKLHSSGSFSTEARIRGIPLPRRASSLLSNNSFLSNSSFQEPELEKAEYSDSEHSGLHSRGSLHCTSPGPPRLSGLSRQSTNSRSTGYLLALAAKNAERQLREQALAAFPNDDRAHPSIPHYLDRYETPVHSSYSTHYELEMDIGRSGHWELKELRGHHEKRAAERMQDLKKREARRRLNKHLDKNPWVLPVTIPIDGSKDEELARMRSKARPPMLGQDLVFPRCVSPDGARFDVTQGPECLRKAMCYLTNQSETPQNSPPPGGLWSPQVTVSHREESVCMWSRAPSTRAPSTGGTGLWGGSCLEAPTSSPPPGQTGLVTPSIEKVPPQFTPSEPRDVGVPIVQQLPPSPPSSHNGITNLASRLELEMTIENEFDDDFITQVYNYMSLGYPAIARDFDEELSKISRIPLAELRQDDHLPKARGYIRLGEDETASDGITEDMCTRWKALKLYVLEWARQQPLMSKPKFSYSGSAWTAARKGSWGF